eukprot:47261-Prorocentrum_minimum.AAC.1
MRDGPAALVDDDDLSSIGGDDNAHLDALVSGADDGSPADSGSGGKPASPKWKTNTLFQDSGLFQDLNGAGEDPELVAESAFTNCTNQLFVESAFGSTTPALREGEWRSEEGEDSNTLLRELNGADGADGAGEKESAFFNERTNPGSLRRSFEVAGFEHARPGPGFEHARPGGNGEEVIENALGERTDPGSLRSDFESTLLQHLRYRGGRGGGGRESALNERTNPGRSLWRSFEEQGESEERAPPSCRVGCVCTACELVVRGVCMLPSRIDTLS